VPPGPSLLHGPLVADWRPAVACGRSLLSHVVKQDAVQELCKLLAIVTQEVAKNFEGKWPCHRWAQDLEVRNFPAFPAWTSRGLETPGSGFPVARFRHYSHAYTCRLKPSRGEHVCLLVLPSCSATPGSAGGPAPATGGGICGGGIRGLRPL
jgi:hypothetical protein